MNLILKKSNKQPLDKAISDYCVDSGISNDTVSEPAVAYNDLLHNKMMIIRTIRKGLPYAVFEKIQQVLPFSEDEWSEYLQISKKTLQRNKQEPGFYFKPILTEKIIALAEVTNRGEEVFDSLDQFYNWLQVPSIALGNMKPSELLKDSYGKEMVMDELNRIDYGIFS